MWFSDKGNRIKVFNYYCYYYYWIFFQLAIGLFCESGQFLLKIYISNCFDDTLYYDIMRRQNCIHNIVTDFK